jgi:hypothetical protein
MIKKLFIGFALILFMVTSAQAALKLDDTVRSFFPQPSKLTGGDERWLGSSISETEIKNGFTYKTSYSYYSPDIQQILNIKRKKTFDVHAAVHVFNNYVSAYDKYTELASKAPKGRVQDINFGDRGVYFYTAKSAYINDADFSIVFINKIFVAEIRADDGFALMDAAAHINTNIEHFIMSNIEFFLIRGMNLSVSADGFERTTDVLGLTEEDPGSISVSGNVFSEDMKPLANAEVTFLETGKAVRTDASGKYSYTVKMGGKKNISISKNFYLNKIEKDEKPKLDDDGLYTAIIKKNDGSLEPESAWRLSLYGNNVYGKTLINGLTYPLKGSFSNDTITLNLDCRPAGSSFKCSRDFEGKINGDKIVGTWSGTGGGGEWSLALNSYAEVIDYLYLNEENSVFESFNKNKLSPFYDTKHMTISAGKEGVKGLHFSLKKDSPDFNDFFIKSAKLIITHLPDKQSGNLRLFSYLTENKSGQTLPVASSMTYVHEATPAKNTYEVETDVSEYIFSTARSGILLSPMLSGSSSVGNHSFAGLNPDISAFAPRLKTVRYAPLKDAVGTSPIIIKLKTESGADFVGSANAIRPDGEADVVFEAVVRMPGKTIKSMEIYRDGSVTRKRNTDPLDIYPAIGFIKNGKPLNEDRGAINILLEQPVESFDLHIAPLKDGSMASYKYLITIGGETFEGNIESR